MLRHIVCWKLKGTEEERNKTIEQFQQMIDRLNALIPEIQSAAVGVNLSEGDCFHVCIDATFRDEKELNQYIYHPEHLKVRAYMTQASYDKMVFDYLA